MNVPFISRPDLLAKSEPADERKSSLTSRHSTPWPRSQYLDEWIELQQSRLQPATWDAYRRTIACYLAPALGDIPLDNLDPTQLERIYTGLLDHGGCGGRRLATGTIGYIHAVECKRLPVHSPRAVPPGTRG
jgi:hypothetical protein